MQTHKIELDAARLIGDPSADQVIADAADNSALNVVYGCLSTPYDKIQQLSPSAPVMFLTSRPADPVWFDRERIYGGQKVFEKYGREIMTLLGILSLPYCYAGYPGNIVIHRSDRMRYSPGKRLLDTASFVINVSAIGSFDPDKFGHIAIQHTRLTHALARYHLQQKQWDKSSWGTPVNQEDTAATNLAFSCLVIIGLLRSGISLTSEEKENYIFLWRYIGFAMGVEESLLPITLKHAYDLAQVFKARNIRASQEGVELTRELIDHYKTIMPGPQANLVESQMRYFLGPEISDLLQLKSDTIRDTLTSGINSFQSFRNFWNPGSLSEPFRPQQFLIDLRKLQGSIA